MKKIHFIDPEYKGNKFIIAVTKCKKHWSNINEFTMDQEETTCKSCLKKLN